MHVVKHVGVVSLAKILAAFGLLLGIVYAALFLSVGPSLPGYTASGSGPAMTIIEGIVGGAVSGFVGGAIIAILYNVFARLVGGVRIELT
ncbi:MAG TPA: hypothetical protein VLU98_00135 [Methanomicrobiales archaeon]|nr:hypothetical protein [Methanomicrobiales archaeon]